MCFYGFLIQCFRMIIALLHSMPKIIIKKIIDRQINQYIKQNKYDNEDKIDV